MINTIIFDFDGVLFNSESLHLRACNEVFQPYNLAISKNEYAEKYIGLSMREMFPLVLASSGYLPHKDEVKGLIVKKGQAYKKMVEACDGLTSVSGLAGFLSYASQIVEHFAICSNGRREEIMTVLNKLEQGAIKRYIDIITTIENVSQGKPSPEGYLKTAEDLGVMPKNCLVLRIHR